MRQEVLGEASSALDLESEKAMFMPSLICLAPYDAQGSL